MRNCACRLCQLNVSPHSPRQVLQSQMSGRDGLQCTGTLVGKIVQTCQSLCVLTRRSSSVVRAAAEGPIGTASVTKSLHEVCADPRYQAHHPGAVQPSVWCVRGSGSATDSSHNVQAMDRYSFAHSWHISIEYVVPGGHGNDPGRHMRAHRA